TRTPLRGIRHSGGTIRWSSGYRGAPSGSRSSGAPLSRRVTTVRRDAARVAATPAMPRTARTNPVRPAQPSSPPDIAVSPVAAAQVTRTCGAISIVSQPMKKLGASRTAPRRGACALAATRTNRMPRPSIRQGIATPGASVLTLNHALTSACLQCDAHHVLTRTAGRTRQYGGMGVDVLERFSPATRDWFSGAFAAPTPAQSGAWDSIASGDNTLVVAPTGSGKTLAAFLWSLDRLATGPVPEDALRR